MKNVDNKKYEDSVNKLKEYLEKDKQKYINEIKEIRTNEVNIKRNIFLENEKMLKDIEKDVSNIIKNEKSKLPVFLKEEAKKIINNKNNKEIREQVFKNDTIDKKEYKKMEKKLII